MYVSDLDLAGEVLESLTIGDHWNLKPSMRRSIVGLILIVAGVFQFSHPQRSHRGSVSFVVANPVAHGAQLAMKVGLALETVLGSIVTEQSVKHPALVSDAHFPGLGLRSIGGVSTGRRLQKSLSMRLALGRMHTNFGSKIWSEYLFFSQSLRYLAARDWIANASDLELVLVDFDRHAYCRPHVYWAKRAGIRVATLLHGSPSSATYLPVLADDILTWGETQNEWLKAQSAEARYASVGRCDINFEDRAEDSLDRLVLCHSGEVLSRSELQRLVRLLAVARKLNWSVHLRRHPSWRSKPLDDGWRVAEEAATEPERPELQLTQLLTGRDLVVAFTSSAAIEAVCLGVRTAVIADKERRLPCDVEVIRQATSSVVDEFLVVADTTALLEGLHGPDKLRRSIVAYQGDAAKDRLAQVVSGLLCAVRDSTR